VRVLIYAGARDPTCSWKAQERMTHALEWTGSAAFRAAGMKKWTDEHGVVRGEVKEAEGLTFVKVDGAGHMVCLTRSSVCRLHDLTMCTGSA
jgi:carboxypeptidase C (cathepsin A)